MSIVIVGGNECMERRYKDLCSEHGCDAKVYTKQSGALKHIGTPDLLVLFTNTVSHKMVRCALRDVRESDLRIAYCHSSSLSALRSVLQEHICKECGLCQKN